MCKSVAVVAWVLVLVVAGAGAAQQIPPAEPAASPVPDDAKSATVKFVPDATSVVLQTDTNTSKYPLAWLDSPAAPGSDKDLRGALDAQTADRLRSFLLNKPVRYVPIGKPGEPGYGVLLYTADGTLVNEAAVAAGDARVKLATPKASGTIGARLWAAQRRAMAGKFGGWADRETLDALALSYRKKESAKEADRTASEAAALPARRIVKQYAMAERLRDGDVYYIHTADPDSAMPAADGILAYQNLVKFAKAGDTDGVDDLMKSGQVALLSNDTAVKLIERKGFVSPVAYEVRVLDGKYEGRLFWVKTGSLYLRREVEVKTGRRK